MRAHFKFCKHHMHNTDICMYKVAAAFSVRNADSDIAASLWCLLELHAISNVYKKLKTNMGSKKPMMFDLIWSFRCFEHIATLLPTLWHHFRKWTISESGKSVTIEVASVSIEDQAKSLHQCLLFVVSSLKIGLGLVVSRPRTVRGCFLQRCTSPSSDFLFLSKKAYCLSVIVSMIASQLGNWEEN